MAFECLSMCGKCCGCVVLDKKVYENNKYKAFHSVKELKVLSNGDYFPVTADNLCLFLGEKKECLIYDSRPMICRDFGLKNELPCPFVKPNGNPRSEAMSKRMLRYNARLLHDARKPIIRVK